jgi:hypothetical protein
MSSSYFLGVWTVAAVLIVLAVPPWRTIGMNLLDLFKRTVGGWRKTVLRPPSSVFVS